MEALSKKRTPASARTGTGAGTARLAPPCTATESSLHLSAPYQCQLIRGQPFMADYRPAAAGRGVPATPRRHSVSCGTPFDSLRRAGRRSGRGQPCSLLISGFSLPGNALPGRATCIRNCSHSWASGKMTWQMHTIISYQFKPTLEVEREDIFKTRMARMSWMLE